MFPALTSRDQFGCTSPFVPEHLRQGLEICANATLGAKVDRDDDNDNDDNADDGGKVHKYMNHRTALLATNMWTKEYFFKPPCTYFTFTITTTNTRKG